MMCCAISTVRGKYRDVILPMTVLRRLDAVLEETKNEVLETKERCLTTQAVVDQDFAALSQLPQVRPSTTPRNSHLRDLRARDQPSAT